EWIRAGGPSAAASRPYKAGPGQPRWPRPKEETEVRGRTAAARRRLQTREARRSVSRISAWRRSNRVSLQIGAPITTAEGPAARPVSWFRSSLHLNIGLQANFETKTTLESVNY